MAGKIVMISKSVEGFELGPEKVGYVDGANDQSSRQLDLLRWAQSVRIPAIRETVNLSAFKDFLGRTGKAAEEVGVAIPVGAPIELITAVSPTNRLSRNSLP